MSQVAHQAGAYPSFRSMKQLGIFLLSLDGMLVHRRVTPSIKFAGTHLYTWVERGTLRVKCLTQEHNAMSPARAQTQTARSGVEHTNHEATVPPTPVSRPSQHSTSVCTNSSTRVSLWWALSYICCIFEHCDSNSAPLFVQRWKGLFA